MATANRVIKNTGFLYFRMFLTLVVSLWTTRIILNAIGIDNFGIYNVVGGAISLLGFLNATMASASQRFLSYAEGIGDILHQRIVFNSCIILHIIISIILGLLIIIASFFFFNGILNLPDGKVFSAKIVYSCMGISAIFTVLSVPFDATINAHENMKFYAFIGILDVILKLVIAYLLLIANSDRLVLYGILMALVPICSFILLWAYCHRNYNECIVDPWKYNDREVVKKMSQFAGWNFVNVFSGMLTQYGLNIVVNHFFGVVLNAAQGIANQVSGTLSNLSANALKALNPIIVKSESQKQQNRMIYISILGCRISFIIFGTLALPMILNMDLILHIWLKTVPQWAVLFCQLSLLRILIEQLSFGLTSAIMARGIIKQYNIWRSVINVIPLIAIPVLFHLDFEPYWLYIVWILSWSCIGGYIVILFSSSIFGLSVIKYFKQIILPSLTIWTSLFIIGYMLLSIGNSVWVQISVTILIVLVFILLSWLFILQESERIQILNFLKISKVYGKRII